MSFLSILTHTTLPLILDLVSEDIKLLPIGGKLVAPD